MTSIATQPHQLSGEEFTITDQITMLSETASAIALTLSCEEVHQTMNEKDIIVLALEITNKLSEIKTLARQL